MTDDRPALRIGEVSRRTGVGVPTLRAWERRYGLLAPQRTEGGHRLYSEADIERVRGMKRLLAEGWSAGIAAAEVLRAPATITPLRALESAGDAVRDLVERVEAAIAAFDATATDAAIDDAFARLQVPRALDEVVLPVLRRVGEGWADDPRVIAREHFASNAIRPRIQRLLRRPSRTGAATCLAVAPEGEEHDLGLLAGAAVAVDAGWRIHYLGARTPVAVLRDAVAALDPDAVLVGAVHRDHALAFLKEMPPLDRAALVLGGAGFHAGDGDALGAVVHEGPISGLPATLEGALRRRPTAP